jgi:hypothetical protein
MTYESAKDDVARYVLALPADQRTDWLNSYINDVIDAVACGRPDLTPSQQGSAVLDFAQGVALRLRLRLHTIH